MEEGRAGELGLSWSTEISAVFPWLSYTMHQNRGRKRLLRAKEPRTLGFRVSLMFLECFRVSFLDDRQKSQKKAFLRS